MNIATLSNYIIPILILIIVLYGLKKKTKVYIDFVDGAKDGFATVIKVMPTLIGLMVAVGMLRESGAMDFCGKQIGKVTKIFSSSAAAGMLLDVYKKYGVDSYIANVASIILSSTETVFYTMSVYFMTANVTKTRWTLPGALFATLAGTIASVMVAKLM